MAKDDRVVNNGVWVEGGLLTDADQIAESLPQERLDQLVESGALSGTWKTTKKQKTEKKEEK